MAEGSVSLYKEDIVRFEGIKKQMLIWGIVLAAIGFVVGVVMLVLLINSSVELGQIASNYPSTIEPPYPADLQAALNKVVLFGTLYGVTWVPLVIGVALIAVGIAVFGTKIRKRRNLIAQIEDGQVK